MVINCHKSILEISSKLAHNYCINCKGFCFIDSAFSSWLPREPVHFHSLAVYAEKGAYISLLVGFSFGEYPMKNFKFFNMYANIDGDVN